MLCGVAEHEFEKFQYNNYYVSGRFLDFENPVEVVMIYRSNYTNSSAALVNSDSSSVFVSAATYSEALVNAGGEVYLFESRQKPYTMHISDMQFFIGIHRESVHTTDMDILDRFYSKMLVNFTKFGEPSPNWQKYDPAKMNFLSLEVDSDRKIEPRMENGFHEELVNFWMIDMFELDQNITEQKKNGNLPVGFLPTEKSISTSASVAVSTINSPTTTTINVPKTNETEEFSTLSPISENYAIYQQWWFPVLILLALLVLIFVFLILKKHINTEYEPI
uniref:COesterase domain-containing protein n=1 Tax=Caenorhabditis japonica TaxID=281687 RepID=A0A8R1IWL6_CAEJA